jgi:hypothetical protein
MTSSVLYEGFSHPNTTMTGATSIEDWCDQHCRHAKFPDARKRAWQRCRPPVEISIADIVAALGSIEPNGRFYARALGGQDRDDLERAGIHDDDLIADQEVKVTLPRRFDLNDCLRQGLQIDETEPVARDSLAYVNIEVGTRCSGSVALPQERFPDSASLFARKDNRRAGRSSRSRCALASLGVQILAARLQGSVATAPFSALSDATPAFAFPARLTQPRLRLGWCKRDARLNPSWRGGCAHNRTSHMGSIRAGRVHCSVRRRRSCGRRVVLGLRGLGYRLARCSQQGSDRRGDQKFALHRSAPRSSPTSARSMRPNVTR